MMQESSGNKTPTANERVDGGGARGNNPYGSR